MAKKIKKVVEEEKIIGTTVTQEMLDENPELKDAGVEVGTIIEAATDEEVKEAMKNVEVVEEKQPERVENILQVFVCDQGGKIVKIFDNTADAYAFAGENGYQVLS